MERISLVSYMRDGMSELGTKEYEDARHDYVMERSRNKEHKLWRDRWNGVSPNMWEEPEWHEYRKARNV